MIPKIIHLCWLSGDPYPRKIQFCIDTWKKLCPDYDIMLWDTNRFDVNSMPWVKQAFDAKKYAFAADYIRLYAVYNYGGIYLDSDVEVLKSFDDVLDLPYFVCQEIGPGGLELAAFGAEQGMSWVKTAMDWYEKRDFIKEDGSMQLEVQPLIMKHFLSETYQWTLISEKEEVVREDDKLCVLPCDWFNAHPFCDKKGDGVIYPVTKNTHCIHHYAGQWREIKSGPIHSLLSKLFNINWINQRVNERVHLYGKFYKV